MQQIKVKVQKDYTQDLAGIERLAKRVADVVAGRVAIPFITRSYVWCILACRWEMQYFPDTEEITVTRIGGDDWSKKELNALETILKKMVG